MAPQSRCAGTVGLRLPCARSLSGIQRRPLEPGGWAPAAIMVAFWRFFSCHKIIILNNLIGARDLSH